MSAFVAVTPHDVPTSPVDDRVDPDTEHPAVPAVDTEYDTAPVPDPPTVDNARSPMPNVFDADELIVSAAWFAFASTLTVCSAMTLEL